MFLAKASEVLEAEITAEERVRRKEKPLASRGQKRSGKTSSLLITAAQT
jgi:hypothetical protein